MIGWRVTACHNTVSNNKAATCGRVPHICGRSFDFASIERARRILETDMLQFLVASVPVQFAENSFSRRVLVIGTILRNASPRHGRALS